MRDPPKKKPTNGRLLLARRTMIALALALRKRGVSAPEIRSICISAAKQATSRLGPLQMPPSKDAAVLGSALALWHRDTRFLGRDGSPKALPAFGRSPSVEALLRAADVRHNTKASVRFLMESRLIYKQGSKKYLPSDRSAKIPSIDTFLVEHIAQGVMRLIETADFNYTARGKKRPLLQRAATVRKLPRKYRAAFREYVNEQGNAFVANVDDWLEARVPRARTKSSAALGRAARVSAGVYAFAYVD